MKPSGQLLNFKAVTLFSIRAKFQAGKQMLIVEIYINVFLKASQNILLKTAHST